MGRVESTATVAVEQAQLIDPSRFRFDTSVARATQQAGAVMEELGKRKIEAQDRISTSNANAAISKAQLDYQQDIVGKPLDQHAGILLKHVNNAKSIAGQQKMSKQARELANARLNAWGQTFAEQGELATVVAMNREAGIRVASDLGDALVNGDAEDIAEAEIAFNEHFASSPEEGRQQKEKIEALAVKQMKDNAISAVQEMAARTPNAVIDRISKEQKHRKKNKEPLDFPELDSRELEQVKDYADTISIKAKDDSEQFASEVISDNYNSISDGSVDVRQMIDDINADQRLTADDKVKAIEKTRTFFTGWHSTEMANKAWPLVDNDTAVQQLETVLTAQSTGEFDMNEVNERINEAANKGLLSRATRDSLRGKAKKGGNDAIDDSVNQFTQRVSNALVARLTEDELRFQAISQARGLTIDEIREQRSVGFMLQVNREQLNRYKTALDTKMRQVQGGRETISGVEATAIAASVWEGFKLKSTQQKITEFKEFSGSIIPRPQGISKDMWDSASDRERSDITAALSQGMSIDDVQEFISR